ncbi:MAG: ATP-binding cassette domain-containing protein [Spirochaetales bacterium]|nr:ATP-binding cassette domain-containing protein [Spirochaetales bacterium]
MSTLNIEGVGKRYGSRRALSDVNLSLPRGKITGLLGANGAGKSTLLKILGGYFFPSEGTVRLGDISLDESPGLWRKKCGYLPEGAPLPPGKSPLSLLSEEYALYFGTPPEPEWIASALARHGLDRDTAEKSVASLSKGYRQRTGLALAVTGEPELLLLDEPFSGLDPSQVKKLRENLRRDRKKRITLFSSHILQEVYALCDRIVIIHKGKVKTSVEKGDFDSWEELDELYSEITGGSKDE